MKTSYFTKGATGSVYLGYDIESEPYKIEHVFIFKNKVSIASGSDLNFIMVIGVDLCVTARAKYCLGAGGPLCHAWHHFRSGEAFTNLE